MIVEHERHHFPAFVFLHLACNFEPADLFIKRIQKLLTGRSACERSAMMLGTAEASEIEQALAGSRERNAHAIKQVNDRRRHVAHGFGWRLIGEKVPAVNRVVKVYPRRITFTFRVYCAVNAALRANGM